MSLLSELNTIAGGCGIPVETGVFSDAAPDTYLVLTPLSDGFDLHADNRPSIDTQEVRLSLFTKGSYSILHQMLLEICRVVSASARAYVTLRPDFKRIKCPSSVSFFSIEKTEALLMLGQPAITSALVNFPSLESV